MSYCGEAVLCGLAVEEKTTDCGARRGCEHVWLEALKLFLNTSAKYTLFFLMREGEKISLSLAISIFAV